MIHVRQCLDIDPIKLEKVEDLDPEKDRLFYELGEYVGPPGHHIPEYWRRKGSYVEISDVPKFVKDDRMKDKEYLDHHNFLYLPNGKALHIADVIYSFIKAKAEIANKDIDDVYVSAYTFKDTWIEMFEAVDNGYDGLDLNQFGEAVKVNCI